VPHHDHTSLPTRRSSDLYPGGGPFHVSPAVITREENAVGRDIYGTGLTTREIYEMNADIRPGNSGGPLVDTRGVVVGVVFARSRSEEHTSELQSPYDLVC